MSKCVKLRERECGGGIVERRDCKGEMKVEVNRDILK